MERDKEKTPRQPQTALPERWPPDHKDPLHRRVPGALLQRTQAALEAVQVATRPVLSQDTAETEESVQHSEHHTDYAQTNCLRNTTT